MEFVEDAAAFEDAVGRLRRGILDVDAVPPLIVEYRSGILSVRDGSHWLEAMRRLGWPDCWVIIWYNREADHDRHGRSMAQQPGADSAGEA
jgi:hypothetical protein